MSACGPATTNFSGSTTVLRICTPLLPTPFFKRAWNDSSKSLYFFLVQRNVLCLGSVLVSPTMVVPSIFQRSFSPSQLSGFKKSSSARTETVVVNTARIVKTWVNRMAVAPLEDCKRRDSLPDARQHAGTITD